MLNPNLPEPELLKTVLQPLLEDFQYWFGRSPSLELCSSGETPHRKRPPEGIALLTLKVAMFAQSSPLSRKMGCGI